MSLVPVLLDEMMWCDAMCFASKNKKKNYTHNQLQENNTRVMLLAKLSLSIKQSLTFYTTAAPSTSFLFSLFQFKLPISIVQVRGNGTLDGLKVEILSDP